MNLTNSSIRSGPAGEELADYIVEELKYDPANLRREPVYTKSKRENPASFVSHTKLGGSD